MKSALLLAIVSVPVALCEGQTTQPKVISDIEHEFHLFQRGIPKSDPDSREFNFAIMALKLRPTECVGYECTQTRIDFRAVMEPLSVYGASSVFLDDSGAMTEFCGWIANSRSDDELKMVCPEIGMRDLFLLRYPLAKRDIARAMGFTEDKLTHPLTAKMAVTLELFSIEGGKPLSRGLLVSEPFFVRITEKDFEIRSVPFREPASSSQNQ